MWKWGDFMGVNTTESEDVLLKKESQTEPAKEPSKQKSAKKSESKEEVKEKSEVKEETEIRSTTKEEEESFPKPEHIEMLQEEIQEKNQQIEEYLSILQRLQAEFENYKKRAERERKEYIEQANRDMVLKLLPVLDNFERALHTGNKESKANSDSFKEGITMIYTQLCKILGAEGLVPIDAVGKEFDPHYHEAVVTAVGDYDDDTIIEELEKGYLFRNRLLRPSKVKVGKRGD